MAGATLQEGAMFVAALAVLMVGFAALLLVWRKAFQSVTVKAGSMEASLRAVEKDVAQINKAVNHVPEGSPTLVQRVAETEAKIDALLRRVDAIGQHVGCNPPTEGDTP
jgi:uncharacterized protein YoxC